MTKPRHVVMFSSGAGSWAAAKRVVAQHGVDGVVLLFTDTRIEDEDNYRFLHEAAANVGAPLVTIADGRDPWAVFKDERFIGSSRVDPCSKILKRELADRWLSAHCDPAATTVYVGIDWSEAHRYERLKRRKAEQGWHYEAPLCDAPYLTRRDVFSWLSREGLRRPRLYDLGFSHANCGGFCVKAGQGHFATLYRTMPDRYRQHEAQEQALRDYLGKDVAILKVSRDGVSRPMTLRELREEIERSPSLVDMYDIGGCGCFLDVETTATEVVP